MPPFPLDSVGLVIPQVLRFATPLELDCGAVLDTYEEENLFNKAIELGQYWEDGIHSLKELPNVIDIRNFGLVGAVEMSPREGQPGARAYDVFTKCFHEKDLLVRTTGDVVALSPPLILERNHIDQIFGRLAEAIRESA